MWYVIQKNLPNTLSWARLIVGLAFAFLPTETWIWLFVFAAATEYLDGALSRLWNVTSKFGRLLDPVADKIFVLAVVVAVYLKGWVELWELAVIGVRDITVALGATSVLLFGDRREFDRMKPRIPGKAATNFQFLFLLVVLIGHDAPIWLTAITGLASTIAAADYLRHYYREVHLQSSEA